MASAHISGPAIANLLACARMSVNEAMRAGCFGPLLKRGRVFYAALDAVERHSGQQFTKEQIALAVAGYPGRLLIESEPLEEPYGAAAEG
jgi:hypothetical protein